MLAQDLVAETREVGRSHGDRHGVDGSVRHGHGTRRGAAVRAGDGDVDARGADHGEYGADIGFAAVKRNVLPHNSAEAASLPAGLKGGGYGGHVLCVDPPAHEGRLNVIPCAVLRPVADEHGLTHGKPRVLEVVEGILHGIGRGLRIARCMRRHLTHVRGVGRDGSRGHVGEGLYGGVGAHESPVCLIPLLRAVLPAAGPAVQHGRHFAFAHGRCVLVPGAEEL